MAVFFSVAVTGMNPVTSVLSRESAQAGRASLLYALLTIALQSPRCARQLSYSAAAWMARSSSASPSPIASISISDATRSNPALAVRPSAPR